MVPKDILENPIMARIRKFSIWHRMKTEINGCRGKSTLGKYVMCCRCLCAADIDMQRNHPVGKRKIYRLNRLGWLCFKVIARFVCYSYLFHLILSFHLYQSIIIYQVYISKQLIFYLSLENANMCGSLSTLMMRYRTLNY